MVKPMSPGQFLASLKRRDFLKGSAALALGAAAPGGLDQAG
jgi:hypothetical protein